VSRSRLPLRLLLVALAAALGLPLAGPAVAAGTPQHQVVGAVPGTNSPHVIDGRVFAITQVGDTVLAGGSFTQVQPVNRSATYDLPYVVAFDAATGAVNTAFAPQLDGTVETLLPGPTPGTVYVGGAFNTIAGVKAKGLVLLDVADGSRVAGFRSVPMNGVVQAVRRVGDRLFVGGTFTLIGGQARGGIASMSATTGVVDSFVTSTVQTNHSWTPTNGWDRAAVGVFKLDVSPDGSRMVAIGNFKTVDGLTRDQVVMWDLTGPAAVVRPDWRARGYEPLCSRSYDSYVRDVDFAPDGSYFVVATTGAPVSGTLCDTAARFETADSGDDVRPTWVAFTGGDTLLSVAVTGPAVYVGGHQRWMNNPDGRDRAGGGAVPRPGIAALDPVNGMPLTWNPGRNPRGAGAYALYASATGLWVGSDTEWIGDFDHKRDRIAFFPLAAGAPPGTHRTATLPGGIYLGSPGTLGAAGVVERNFDGTTAGPATTVDPAVSFATARGATLVGRTLYYGRSDANLYRRSFDGATFGPEQLVDPYNDPKWSTVSVGGGSTVTYRGAKPSFYAEIPSVTSMFYDGNGRLYYTVSTSSSLFWRAFSPDSGIVHNTRRTAGGSIGDAGGAFLVGTTLYYVSRTTGNLNRVGFVDGAVTGSPTLVSGPLSGGIDWRARAVFLGPTVLPNQPPAAVPAVTCTALACWADGTGSTDPDGTVASYSWNWGDGTPAGTGATATHTYAVDGTYDVTLTVTDDDGATGSATRPVTVARPAASPIAFRDTAGVNTNSAAPALTVPASVQAGDALALLVTTKAGTTHAAPAGWTPLTTGGSTAVSSSVWQKVATAADAGSPVTVTLGELTKVDVRLLAYSGTAASDPVAALVTADAATTTSHPAPTATVSTPGSWVVWYWADKSPAATTSWTAPADVTVRGTALGTGTVYISSLTGDLGTSSAIGSVPGPTATTNAASRGAAVSLVLAPTT
jgi:PKD repeat protein